MQPNPAIFAPILAAALLLFAVSCWRRFSLITLGQPEDRFHSLGKRIGDMLLYAFGQKRVVAKPFGLNHFVIFWAFMILLLANGEFLLRGVFPGLSLALLPAPLHHGLLYAFDLVSLLTLGSIALAVSRRLFFPPPYLETRYVKARSFEALLILISIALLMAAYFALHGAEIAMGLEPAAAYMPVSNFTAKLLQVSPFASSLVPIAWFSWWLHAAVLLLFMNYLPHSKHMHILTAIPNCFFQSLEKPNTQPREEFAKGNLYGAGAVTLLTWKDLFDSYSCTECGRCQNACPAGNTGKELNPRQVVHDIKVNLLANAPFLKRGEKPQLPLIGSQGEGSVSEESIWACTTCGACMEACPVMIEQMPKIISMRRHLVQMEAKFPEELLNLFENMEGRSNPWGIAPTERTKWSSTMEVKPFEKEKTEYLFYVGCAGSFDSRQKHVTVALATILDAAGVSWGILGKEEKCCGDSLRRLGNEFLFDKMARENVEIFREKGVSKVIVQCPHCFSTLKNDYRQYGLELEVIHHSELLDQLLKSGRLKLNRQVAELGRIVFHDSCYLGRHNDVYQAPREALRLATGAAPAEMERNRENAFCCGAGGGRMWMEEFSGTRINLSRVEEALASKPDTVCVSCPYCLTMFEDGLKDKQASRTRVRDIAEVVAEGLRG
ncbi:MAG: (Fe-S)-binding protein [Geobacteraceae bacterium]|nr:(Fe-S)-binding protein [Geobacteraceae bacterium]